MCRVSWNLEASTVWDPQGLSRYFCTFKCNVIGVSAHYEELASWCNFVAITRMNSKINTDDRRWHDLSDGFKTTSHVRTRVRDRTWLTCIALKWLFRLATNTPYLATTTCCISRHTSDETNTCLLQNLAVSKRQALTNENGDTCTALRK